MKYTLKENEKITIEIVNGCVVFTTEEKEKEKEKEPFFVNSHGSKFYDGDKVYWVVKINLQIHSHVPNGDEGINYKGTKYCSEYLTKEQAEQYVKDNRV